MNTVLAFGSMVAFIGSFGGEFIMCVMRQISVFLQIQHITILVIARVRIIAAGTPLALTSCAWRGYSSKQWAIDR